MEINPVGLWRLVYGRALVHLSDPSSLDPIEESGVWRGDWEIFATVEVVKKDLLTELAPIRMNPALSRINEELHPVMPNRPYVLLAEVDGPLHEGYRGRWALRVALRSLKASEAALAGLTTAESLTKEYEDMWRRARLKNDIE